MMKKKTFTCNLIGLNESIIENIKETITNSHLSELLTINHPPYNTVQDKETLKNLPPGVKYDLLLVAPQPFKQPIGQLISFIKQIYPFSEIILVLFNTHYRSAVQAFRMGVRDVLSYPFTTTEVIVSLDRALSYRTLLQSSSGLQDIWDTINYFSDYRKFFHFQDLYDKMISILYNKLQINKFYLLQYESSKDDFHPLEKIGNFDSVYQGSLSENILSLPNKSNELVNKQTKLDHYEKDLNKIDHLSENESELTLSNFKELADHIQKLKIQMPEVVNISFIYQNNTYTIFDFGILENIYFIGLYIQPYIGHYEIHHYFIQQFTYLIRGVFQQRSSFSINRKLTSLVFSDDVTHLYNKRKLESDLDYHIQRFKQFGEIFSVLFIDIDHFKSVNDHYGHLVGSDILVHLSRELQKIVRETDLIYRYGGDEFVIILPNISGEVTCKIALRILSIIKKHTFEIRSQDQTIFLNLSISLGVSEYPSDANSKESIMACADKMMYSVKKQGRGAVCFRDKLFTVPS